MNIKTSMFLFFDMDNTLVHTDLANFLSYKKAVKVVLEKDLESQQTEGRFTRSGLKKIFPNIGQQEFEKILSLKENFYEKFLNETKLNEELYTFLKENFSVHPCFLITRCSKDRAYLILKYYHLTGMFVDILTDCPQKKYEYAFSKYDIDPKSVMAFEDEKDAISELKRLGVQEVNRIK